MTKDERRDQLLDVAAEMVLAGGMQTLTMERLADRAGVSRSLPYTHFDSIDHTLLELYRREARVLGEFIWGRLDGADPADDLVDVHIAAYFDGLDQTGDVFGALTVPGSSVAANVDPRWDGPRFTRRVLQRFHGVPHDRARTIAGPLHAAILGAGNALRRGVASRDRLQSATAHLFRSALTWQETVS